MRSPKPLKVHRFGSGDPLSKLVGENRLAQAAFLQRYLTRLGARSVIEEPYYFDRDYLSEFSSFYGTSARGYENVCSRLTFFSSELTEESLTTALGGGAPLSALQDAFLGFLVLRPTDRTPLGKTVVKWYPDEKLPRRVIGPARAYDIHLVGVPLRVKGLAWQQQDVAVGSCATIALWSMMHSSAFDEHHAVPTTAEVTRSASHAVSSGARTFPSRGLTTQQMCEAIKAHDLVPDVLDGDLPAVRIPEHTGKLTHKAFRRRRFGAAVGLFLRSGYAVLVSGRHFRNGAASATKHAIACVGLRVGANPTAPRAVAQNEDEGLEYLYVHDDNVGPGARMRMLDGSPDGPARLVLDAPGKAAASVTKAEEAYGTFVPDVIVAALHADIRLPADKLHETGIIIANHVADLLAGGDVAEHVVFGVRVMPLWEYLGPQLERMSLGEPLLAQARRALSDTVPPMSRYVGVIRMRVGAQAFADVLIDTTDQYACVFANVAFDEDAAAVFAALGYSETFEVGVAVRAFP